MNEYEKKNYSVYNILSLNANFQIHKFPQNKKEKKSSTCAESLSIYMRTLWDNLFLSAKSK